MITNRFRKWKATIIYTIFKSQEKKIKSDNLRIQ